MEGESRFPDSLINAVRGKNFDGRSIVEISKLVLLENYTDVEYDQDFFNVFNIILDDDRDGLDFNEIEAIYKKGFIDSLINFRDYFSI